MTPTSQLKYTCNKQKYVLGNISWDIKTLQKYNNTLDALCF